MYLNDILPIVSVYDNDLVHLTMQTAFLSTGTGAESNHSNKNKRTARSSTQGTAEDVPLPRNISGKAKSSFVRRNRLEGE
jgi:hypothetical protein